MNGVVITEFCHMFQSYCVWHICKHSADKTRGVQERIPHAPDSIPAVAEVGTICGCT